jgi:predicted dinucleotide-binding enzyme
MDIVILGSGNVAAVLGRKFKAAGHRILQVISRNASAASKLAYEWDTESSNYPSIAKPNADIYIIAVSDDAIDDVIANIHCPRKWLSILPASVSKDILKT